MATRLIFILWASSHSIQILSSACTYFFHTLTLLAGFYTSTPFLAFSIRISLCFFQFIYFFFKRHSSIPVLFLFSETAELFWLWNFHAQNWGWKRHQTWKTQTCCFKIRERLKPQKAYSGVKKYQEISTKVSNIYLSFKSFLSSGAGDVPKEARKEKGHVQVVKMCICWTKDQITTHSFNCLTNARISLKIISGLWCWIIFIHTEFKGS